MRFFDWDNYLLEEPEAEESAVLDGSLTFPAPYFGGKRRAAALIWSRIGDVVNYVTPFGGSGADILARPSTHRARVETYNDLDGLLVNVWRALRAAPMEVADVCDQPVAEVDLHARHRALVAARADLSARLEGDTHYHDVELAGWWLWGASCWIGQGWCDGAGRRQLPFLSGGADGPATKGMGVHSLTMRRQLPDLGGSTKGDATFANVGNGVNGAGMREPSRQTPDLSGGNRDGAAARHGAGVHGVGLRTALHDTFTRLAARVRYVRFPCGDWKRVMTPAVTWRHGLTGILLDPPYDDGAVDYAVGGRVSSEVRAWCVEHWDDRLPNGSPAYRAALCGYEGEHDELEKLGWDVVAWKARGGYGNQRKNGANENARRERIWFSPHCLKVDEKQPSLFDLIKEAS